MTTSAQLESASESRGHGSPVGGPPRSPRRERPLCPRGSPAPARPIARLPGRTRRSAAPEAGRAARPSPRRASRRRPGPAAKLLREPPASPARNLCGRFSLTCLSRCRRWRPSTPPFPTRRRRRRHCCRRRRPRPTPARDVTRTRRRSFRLTSVAALPNQERRCLRMGGAWRAREALPWRSRRPRAACQRHLPALVRFSGLAPALLAPGPGAGDLHRRSPMPREAKRLQRRQRPRGFSTKSLGPGPERASLALGVPRALSGARSPSPHFPWGFPTEPFLREDAFFSFLVFGEQSRSSPAPWSGGVPPGPGPGKARRVWRGSDAGKAERTSSGRAHGPARQSGARE